MSAALALGSVLVSCSREQTRCIQLSRGIVGEVVIHGINDCPLH